MKYEEALIRLSTGVFTEITRKKWNGKSVKWYENKKDFDCGFPVILYQGTISPYFPDRLDTIQDDWEEYNKEVK